MDVAIALDVAASSFAVPGGYRLSLEHRSAPREEWIEMLARWCRLYPIVSIEDPVHEDDDEGFVESHESTRRPRPDGWRRLSGDQCGKIPQAGSKRAGNAALLKVNQCGTVTELIAAAAAARDFGWRTVQSGRSGESEDASLAHLAVGLLSDQIKVGSIARSERTAKWNEVLRIEETLPAGALKRYVLPGSA